VFVIESTIGSRCKQAKGGNIMPSDIVLVLVAVISGIFGVITKLIEVQLAGVEVSPPPPSPVRRSLPFITIALFLVSGGAIGFSLKAYLDQPGLNVASLNFEDGWVMHQIDVNDGVIQTIYPVVEPDPANSKQNSLRTDMSLDLSASTKPSFWLDWIKASPFRASHISGRVWFASADLSLTYLMVCGVSSAPDPEATWGCHTIDINTDVPAWIPFDFDLTQPLKGVNYSNIDLARVVISGIVKPITGASGSHMTVYVDDFNVS
jgi:hypothetical protein